MYCPGAFQVLLGGLDVENKDNHVALSLIDCQSIEHVTLHIQEAEERSRDNPGRTSGRQA